MAPIQSCLACFPNTHEQREKVNLKELTKCSFAPPFPQLPPIKRLRHHLAHKDSGATMELYPELIRYLEI